MIARQVDSGIFVLVGGIGFRKSLLLLFAVVISLAPSFAEEPTDQVVRVSKLSRAELSTIRERALGGDPQAQFILGLAYDGANRAFRMEC